MANHEFATQSVEAMKVALVEDGAAEARMVLPFAKLSELGMDGAVLLGVIAFILRAFN